MAKSTPTAMPATPTTTRITMRAIMPPDMPQVVIELLKPFDPPTSHFPYSVLTFAPLFWSASAASPAPRPPRTVVKTAINKT